MCFLSLEFNSLMQYYIFFIFNIAIVILFSVWFLISLFGKVNTLYICVRQKWSADTQRLSGIDFPPDDFQRNPTNSARHTPAFLSHARHFPLPRKRSQRQLIRKLSEKSIAIRDPIHLKPVTEHIFSRKKFFVEFIARFWTSKI